MKDHAAKLSWVPQNHTQGGTIKLVRLFKHRSMIPYDIYLPDFVNRRYQGAHTSI